MSIFYSLLNTYPVSRVRRNHGLEHATIHILSRKFPGTRLVGHSDLGGFWILGELNIEQLQSAVADALDRMRAGEHDLAIHPNCGTNFVTAGIATGLAGAFAMLGAGRKWQDKLARIPMAIILATLAMIFAQSLGFILQEQVTTSGKPGDLKVVDITATRRGNFKAHRVTTRG